MKVVWTERARDRLREIFEYISGDSPNRATKICNTLLDRADLLARHPLSGPLLPEDPAYRQLVIEGYRLVYRVEVKHVIVMTVVGPGMRYKSSL